MNRIYIVLGSVLLLTFVACSATKCGAASIATSSLASIPNIRTVPDCDASSGETTINGGPASGVAININCDINFCGNNTTNDAGTGASSCLINQYCNGASCTDCDNNRTICRTAYDQYNADLTQPGSLASDTCVQLGVTCGFMGVCTDTTQDPEHCGLAGASASASVRAQACSHKCADNQTCSHGTCTTCPGNQVRSSNGNTCGCLSGQTLIGTQCVSCPSAQPAICGTQCVDLTSDKNNCGSCGHVCPNDAVSCINGTCVCPSGMGYCGGTCVSLNTDSNCGTCGNVCPGDSFGHAKMCSSGQCVCPTWVAGGTWDPAHNGCYDYAHDSSNCGSFGHVCPGTSICGACDNTASQCSGVCTPWCSNINAVISGNQGTAALCRFLVYCNGSTVTPYNTYNAAYFCNNAEHDPGTWLSYCTGSYGGPHCTCSTAGTLSCQ